MENWLPSQVIFCSRFSDHNESCDCFNLPALLYLSISMDFIIRRNQKHTNHCNSLNFWSMANSNWIYQEHSLCLSYIYSTLNYFLTVHISLSDFIHCINIHKHNKHKLGKSQTRGSYQGLFILLCSLLKSITLHGFQQTDLPSSTSHTPPSMDHHEEKSYCIFKVISY